MESYKIFLVVQGNVDLLSVYLDKKSHEETSEGVSSVPGRDRTGSLQETIAHLYRTGITTGWKRSGVVSRDNTEAMESILHNSFYLNRESKVNKLPNHS